MDSSPSKVQIKIRTFGGKRFSVVIKQKLARYFLPFILLLGTCQSLYAQPGRDLEYKGKHPSFHFSDSTSVQLLQGYPHLEVVLDSVPPAHRVYVTYDTIQGFMLNGHRTSVYEFPSMLRYALTNPARKGYLPKEQQSVTILFLIDYPIFDYNYRPSYRSEIGPDFLTASIFNVLYDIWNEDARYTEDKTFALLDEETQLKVARRNPHRIQWLNFSDEYSPASTMPDPTIYQTQPTEKRNIVVISLGEESINLDKEEVLLDDLETLLYLRMSNPDSLETWPEEPASTHIYLGYKRETRYDVYLDTYAAIMNVYKRFWNEAANKSFGKEYADLNDSEKKTIHAQIPLHIIEAEPESFED
ncbi:MAG: hypothetical protein GYB31_03430 [Bacteroidetes bacterium]|nr:hypothetical protein [Bacteroidota bacterium]